MIRRPIRFLPFLLLPLLAGPNARAQQLYTYNGPFTGTGAGANPWSTDNWIGGTPVSGAATQLLFTNADTTPYTASNDLGNPFLLNGLFLNSTAQVNTTVNSSTGSGFQLTGANPFLSLGGPGSFTVAGGGNGLVLAPTSGTTTVTGAGDGALTLGSNAAVISGAGGLTVNLTGGGAASLFGANTFTGGVTLNAGILAVGSAGALGAGALTVNGGSLRATLPTVIANPVVLNGDLRFTSGNLTLTGPVSGAGGLTVLNGQNFNTQTLTLGGALTYTGATTIQNSIPRQNPATGNLGALLLTSGASIAGAQPVTVGNNGTLSFTGNNPYIPNGNPLALNGGRLLLQGVSGGALNQTFGTVTASGLSVVTLTAAATSNTLSFGALNRQGNATLFLTGPFNGNTNVLTFASGLASVSDPQAPGGANTGQYLGVVPFASGNITSGAINAGALVNYDPALGVRYIGPTNAANVQQVAAGGTFDANTQYKNANLAGAGVTVNGAQRVNSLSATATGQVTGTGTLTVSSGAVLVATVSAFPVAFNGPTLDFGAATGYLHLGGSAAFQGSSAITGSGGLVVSGLDAPGSAAGNGAGGGYTVQFSGANANPFTGGLFVNGNAGVNFVSDAQLGAAGGAVTLGGGGLTFNPAAGALVTNRPLILGAAGGNLNVNPSDSLQWAGTISGPGALAIGSSSGAAGGVVSLTGSNTYAGPTYVYSGGTVAIVSDANLGSLSAPLTLNGGTVQFAAPGTFAKPIAINSPSTLDTGANAVTYTGAFSGVVPSGLTKIGAGTLSLAGASPLLAGRFTVSAGTLAFAGGALPQVTTLTVNSGAALAGTGSVGGSVSVLAGGTFAPGTATAPGRLAVGASLLLPGGTFTVLDLQGTTAATGYSQATVGGALTLGGNLSVNLLAGFQPSLGAKFYVFDLTGLMAANGAFAGGTGPNGTLFADQAGNTYQINYADRDPADTSNALPNDVSLTVVGVTAGVPEPSTLALLGLGAGAMALAARRRTQT